MLEKSMKYVQSDNIIRQVHKAVVDLGQIENIVELIDFATQSQAFYRFSVKYFSDLKRNVGDIARYKKNTFQIKPHPKNFYVLERNINLLFTKLVDREKKKGNPNPLFLFNDLFGEHSNFISEITGFTKPIIAQYQVVQGELHGQCLNDSEYAMLGEFYSLFEALLIIIEAVCRGEVDQERQGINVYFRAKLKTPSNGHKNGIFRFCAFRGDKYEKNQLRVHYSSVSRILI